MVSQTVEKHIMAVNTLTIQEARAIVRHRGYGQKVADSLFRLALITLNADKPVVIYEPIDWYEDDGSEATFDEMELERGERLLEAVRRDAAFRNGGL